MMRAVTNGTSKSESESRRLAAWMLYNGFMMAQMPTKEAKWSK